MPSSKKNQSKRKLKPSKSQSVPEIAANKQPSDPNIDKCAFCLATKKNPVEIQCNHTFCKSCYDAYLEQRGWDASTCPLCRRPLILRDKKGPLKKVALVVGFMVLLLGVILYNFAPIESQGPEEPLDFWDSLFGN